MADLGQCVLAAGSRPDQPYSVPNVNLVIAHAFQARSTVLGLLRLKGEVRLAGGPDLRYALRGIIQSPFLSFAVLLALLPGVGLNAAVLSHGAEVVHQIDVHTVHPTRRAASIFG
jgi:hypothetical protein